MDIKPYQQQRPAQQAQPAKQSLHSGQSRRIGPSRGVKPLVWPTVGGMAIAIVALVAFWSLPKLASADTPDSTKYQIVYTVNGQAYFGKIVAINDDFLVMQHVYVAKSENVPNTATEKQKQDLEQNTAIVRTTSQVYGPEDKMQLSKQNVLFWQDLSKTSKVSQAINQDQSQ